jgi:ketosteroid isomerase-like protein
VAQNFVTEMFRKIDSRDWEALPSSFADDAVYERPGYAPLQGIDRIMKFYREERVIASGEHRLERVVIGDAAGASWGRFVGLHKNGSALDEAFADVYILNDQGKIKTRRSYFFRPAI